MNKLEQDLAFVRAVVEDSRRALRVDAWPLLVWGLLSLVGVLLTYLWPSFDSIWLWVALIGLAWAMTAWRVLSRVTAGPGDLAGRALARLWFGLFGSMTLIGFAGSAGGALSPAAIPPIVAALFGAGYLASAALLQQTKVVLLGLSWWLGALLLFFLPAPVRLAVFGALLLLLLVLPVLVLLRSQHLR